MTAVRIGIVSWNTGALLSRCLDALLAEVADLDAEVVVVDNASSDGSAALAEGHGVTVFRNETNLGYAKAMNTALAGTEAAVLVALNPDAVLRPGALRTLLGALAERPAVGLVAPRLVNDDGSLQHSAHRFLSVRQALLYGFLPAFLRRGALGRRWWLEGAARHDEPADVDWAVGAMHVIRRAALAGEPPYRERWFMYAEDMDLCWRLRRRDWAIRLDPRACVVHTGRAAAVQRWGDDSEVRMLAANYDWYTLERGRGPTLLYAAVNLAANVSKLGVLALLAGIGGPPSPSRAGTTRRLRLALPYHLRALAGRPLRWTGPGCTPTGTLFDRPGPTPSRRPSSRS